MAELPDGSAPLDAKETARLTDFARACKAAARAVLLYPTGHPAIAATLGRIAHITSPSAQPLPMKISVLPDGLELDDRAPAKPDAALTELATLLHSHLIGEMTVHPGGDIEAWRAFLLLVGRSPESVRTDGGIARVWTTMAGRHVDLREIDYAEVLRERAGGDSAAWKRIVDNCLQGSSFDLDEDGIRELLGIAVDSEQLTSLMAKIEGEAGGDGAIGLKTAALLRLLRGIFDVVSKKQPEQVEPVLKSMAAAVGQCSPDVLLGLLGQQSQSSDDGPPLMQAVVSRMTDSTIASFVSRHVIAGETSTDRLAQAFQTLVRDGEEQQRLLALAREDVAASPLGSTEGFESVWNNVAEKMITSYSDEPFVNEAYGRELSGARARAIEVEDVSDDPPERISGWLGTIATTSLRALDLTLMLDLLRIEPDEEKWRELMKPLVGLVDDLLLVGDFDAAAELIGVLVREAADGSGGRRQIALTAIDVLIAGSMMRHVTTHLATIDEAQFERVKAMCVSLGEVLVRPLAEALSVEERPRTRERLTSVLLAFGSVGRRTIERLKNSQNPAVRRTAIHLMRQFGGSESLPDLTELLDDNEPQVQREAVRAILNVGTDAAFKILEQALTGGTTRSREAIMQSIGLVRDERATPLFTYILGHIDHRGALGPVYLRAIESLGALRDPGGVAPLRTALYKGEWWAPRRTGALRAAAASALARIGTPEAIAVLDEAVASGSRGVRSAARAQLTQAHGRRPARASGDEA